MRRAAKVDSNQGEIVEALERAGCRVLSLAPLGRGCPDLLVEAPIHGLLLMEVKRPKGKVRASQRSFQQRGWPVYIVRSVHEALQVIR